VAGSHRSGRCIGFATNTILCMVQTFSVPRIFQAFVLYRQHGPRPLRRPGPAETRAAQSRRTNLRAPAALRHRVFTVSSPEGGTQVAPDSVYSNRIQPSCEVSYASVIIVWGLELLC
jgi:hypothetical protein